MIKSIYIENYSAFEKRAELNLEADNRIKRFPDNISKDNIIKSAVIYGPNNTGKTAFIEGISIIQEVLLNKNPIVMPNIFTNQKYSKFGITFLYNQKTYQYEFSISMNNKIPYEKFSLISNKEETIFLKDHIKKIYKSIDSNLQSILPLASQDNILIYTINTDNSKILQEAKDILINFAQKLLIINMNNISNAKTIEILKNKDQNSKKLVSFIKNADLYLDDYYYEENGLINEQKLNNILKNPNVLKNERLLDEIRLISVYKGIKVPSLLFDSLGTQKIVALSSFIIEALDNDKIIIVDELDSSLHFKITRAIISLFNNELNKNAQLICTVHDTDLLDCKTLFRKEQIWFTDKDENGAKLYSLKNFTYLDSGIRDTTDVFEKYNKGLLGAIPNPDLLNYLDEDS